MVRMIYILFLYFCLLFISSFFVLGCIYIFFFLPFLGYPFKDKGQHKCEEEKMEMSHN